MADIYKSAQKPYRKSEGGRYGENDENLPAEDKPRGRPADVFAGKGSLAGKLRERREAVEAGPEALEEYERKQREGQ